MSAGVEAAHGFDGVLETCIYHSSAQAEEMERFYAELLALPVVARWPGGMAFRVGPGLLLLFDHELLAAREGPISEHGASGAGHACLLADGPEALDGWKARLRQGGLELSHEQEWESGRRSIYFRDPAGNLLEIADGDLWPR